MLCVILEKHERIAGDVLNSDIADTGPPVSLHTPPTCVLYIPLKRS